MTGQKKINSSESREKHIISPLRYPGAKRRLAAYIKEAIILNSLHPKLFVEPFAGGASVSLQLLNEDVVDAIALGESDPLVSSFWKVVFGDPKWLIEQIENISVTVDNWRYFKENQFRTIRERALACIFLNRTSFSGILAPSAGPIGGHLQKSKYKIDCRFYAETIANRIRQISKLRHRVLFVDNADWQTTIRKVDSFGFCEREVVFYIDPPFYNKSDRLYRHCFNDEAHVLLHDVVTKLCQPWLLSYDPAKPIISIYSQNGKRPKHVDFLYSISAGRNIYSKELIITNLQKLPNNNVCMNNDWQRKRH